MSGIPRDKSFDSTLAFLSEGYRFISNRCNQYETDAFRTRLMLAEVVCMRGEEAARAFYHPGRFTRRKAVPQTTLRLLQDKGSVQTLDGEAHRWRKQMFMSLMDRPRLEQLAEHVADEWRARIDEWEAADQIVLLNEVQEILCRAACRWAGIPLAEAEAPQRTREFAAMIEGAGSVGFRCLRGLVSRSRAERWMRRLVEDIRDGEMEPPEDSAASVIAWHRDLEGSLLDTNTAAVELINIVRPAVAVARYVVFAALALHDHPECRQAMAAEGDSYIDLFAQEVRRFYPFFPVIGGRVLNEFTWRDHHFIQGAWVLLDLYGTNHDPRAWSDPESFSPERFREWNGSEYNFIPQGGGDNHTDHRCAGEWATIEILKAAVRLLTTTVVYNVPAQDLCIDLSRMPAEPRSRFIMANVRSAE